MISKLRQWLKDIRTDSNEKIGKTVIITDPLRDDQRKVIEQLFSGRDSNAPDKLIYKGHIYVCYGKASYETKQIQKESHNLDQLEDVEHFIQYL